MHIRGAEIRDIDQITKLGKQLFKLHIDFNGNYYALEENFEQLFSTWVKEQLTIPQRFIIVAEENRKIVGFISGFIKALFPWFRTKTVGHISYLVIDSDFQKRGIGKLLEKQAAAWFKFKNISYIELYVEENNLAGQKAWSTYGFNPFKKFLQKKI